MPLHKNVRRCSFVKIHKPGDLLKKSKLLPMKARLHTQRNDILLHTEYESRIFVLPYIRRRVPLAEGVDEVCFQEKGSRFFCEYDETEDQDIRRKSQIMKRNSKQFLALFMAAAMSVTPVSYAYAEDVSGQEEETTAGQGTDENQKSQEEPKAEENAAAGNVTEAEKKETGEEGKAEEKASEDQNVETEEAAENAGEVKTQESGGVESNYGMFNVVNSSVRVVDNQLEVTLTTASANYGVIYFGKKEAVSNENGTVDEDKVVKGTKKDSGYEFVFKRPIEEAGQKISFVPGNKNESGEYTWYTKKDCFLTIPKLTESGKDDAENPGQGGNSGENKPGTGSGENQKEDESTNKTLPGGKYAIKEVTSSSTMFNVVSCELISANGEMYADITLNKKGYDYLYAGTADKAGKAKQEEWSHYKEDALGRYVYRVKVTSVDKGIAIAAHSIKNDKWYDRTLTFNTAGMTKAVEAEDGTYKVNVTSSSTMFNVVDCVLTSKNGKMTAKVTLGGTGYDYLYAGTSAKAAVDSANWVAVVEENGKYTYIIPVDALDAEIPVAAHSIKNNKWYDRTLVFSSTGVKKPGGNGSTNGNTGNTGSNNNTGNNTNQNNNSGTTSGNTGANQTPDKESKYEADLSGGTARVNSATTLADGVYTPDKFSWSGGTGKVSISCTKITVTGGQAYATIVFSSGSYGYVKANGNTYYPTATGSTSTFVIPVELNKNNTIIGMTTKMSTAHEISYSIFIYLSAAAKADGTTVSGVTNLSADTLDEKAPEIMGLSYQSETKVEHAEYFKIYHYDQGITLLEIAQRKDEDTKETKTKDKKEDTDSGLTPAQEEQLALYKAKIVRYLIVPENAEIPAGLDKEMIVIQQPKKSAYVGSEEVLEILDELNATEQITSVGVKQKNCKVESIAKAMKEKKITYAGTYKKPENKKLMKSKCDLAILSNKILPDEKNDKKLSVEDQQKRYEELAEKFVLLDIPMIVDRSADEEKDDAKAEWSKVYEAIFAQTESAGSTAKN